MERSTRGLGFRLIMVSVAIVAVAALVVAVVVTKLSEDEVKSRLMRQAEELANLVEGVLAAGGEGEQLSRVVLGAKLKKVGSAWVVGSDGRLITGEDVRSPVRAGKCLPFGDAEIELTAVRQPVAQMAVKAVTHKVPLKSVAERYDAGMGIMECIGEPHVVAFHVLRDRGWIVGVDEPYTATFSSSASLKKYILLTCLILGLCILLSTAFSISFIIKPFYRERLELSEKIEAANRNLKKLHQVSVSMQRSLALEERVNEILAAAHEVLRLDRIFLYLANPENTILVCIGAFGNQDESPADISLPLGPEGGVIANAFLKKKTFRVANARELPRELRLRPPYSEFKALRSRDFIVYPMIVENSCLGVVAADNVFSKAPITDDTIEGLEVFASQAAVAIQNAQLYRQLKLYADELEVTDHLTQLFTFFHFKKLLQGEIDRMRVSGEPLSLAVFSVENFARYNELLGHKHGDNVLRQTARVIRDTVRKKEVIGRCFGSTFAVMFPNTEAAAAQDLMHRAMSNLEGETYPGQEAMGADGVQFVYGLAEYPRGEGWGAEDFFAEVNERARKGLA